MARGEIQEDNASFTWKICDKDVVNNEVIIRYSASLDRYEYLSGNKVINKVEQWNKGTFKCSGIFRKKELDWKMVYLTRTGKKNT